MNENSEMDPAPEKALEELRNEERRLAGLVGEERRVEGEIAATERRIEGLIEEVAHDSKIKVNGRTRVIEGREIDFEEVVKLAFPSGHTKPNTKFTVTFRNAAQVPAMGELDPGQTVKVKPGRHEQDETIFNVTETVLS